MGIQSLIAGHVDAVFESASGLVGTPPDQLKLIAALVLSIPLAIPITKLPASSDLIHLYSVLLSWIFLTQLLHLHSGFLQLLGQSVGTYYATKFCHDTRKPKPWYWAIFVGNMGLLTFNHFSRWVTNTPLDIVEITGAQMVLVMKLSLFSWACYDGTRAVEQLDAIQKRDRLVELPSLLAFLGYSFYFASVLIGPTFTYQSYAAYVDRSLFASVKGKEKELRMPPGRWRKAGERATIAAVYLGIYAVFGGRFDYTQLLSRTRYNFWSNFVFMQMAGFMARTKYYAVWDFTEAAMIVSGLAYEPETGKWNRGRNVQIRQIETAQTYKTLLDAWNCGTNYWLRECVYKRLARPGRRPGFKSTMATFTTSAFWHGFNPTYYITFILGGFLQALGRKIRTNLRPLFLPANYMALSASDRAAAEGTLIKRVYDLLSWAAVQITLNFIVAPFMLLEVAPTMRAWSAVGYYGLWVIFGSYALFQFVLPGPLRRMQLQRAKAAGVDEKAIDAQRKQAKRESDKGAHIMPNVHQAVKRELEGHISEMETDDGAMRAKLSKTKGK